MVILGGLILLALGVIALDIAARRKRLDTITAVYFGMIVGLLLTYVLGLALAPLPSSTSKSAIPFSWCRAWCSATSASAC